MLRYVERLPVADVLRRHVRCLWLLTGSGEGCLELVTPDGCIELVLHLADPVERIARHEATANLCAVVGPGMEWLSLRFPKRVRTFGVRFRPAGARHFLRGGLRELGGESRALDAYWGDDSCALRDALNVALTDEEAFAALEASLLRRLQPVRGTALVEDCLASIQNCRGNVRVGGLARAVGRSVRTIQRDFEGAVGLSPKQFARICRFQAAADAIPRVGQLGGWAGLAAEFGYADQSHLIREFRRFTGMAPLQYASGSHALNDALISSRA